MTKVVAVSIQRSQRYEIKIRNSHRYEMIKLWVKGLARSLCSRGAGAILIAAFLGVCERQAFCASATATNQVHETNPGDEVIVVYNSRMPESKRIAEHYAQCRHVSHERLFGFELSTGEDMSRDEFRDALQTPLAKALDSRKLWRIGSRLIHETNNQPAQLQWKPVMSRLRYAVLCYGVPVKILPDPSLHEAATENMRPEIRRNEASVDTELALLPLYEEKLPLGGPLRNPTYGVTNTALLHPTNGVLMVTRLDGPSADIAYDLVDKALQAEKSGLWGRAYFDLWNSSEPGMKLGDEWIGSAAEICKRLGFETVVDTNTATFPASFPMSQIAIYMGWYSTEVCGPFAQPKVEFMPGAFAYHLHSYSAAHVRSPNSNWVGPFLAKGVTCTMGCVDEPYLGGTPEVGVFAARFVYEGFTFGEAAYASQPVLSWQTTFVGDPLYRPFAKNPEQMLEELTKTHSPYLDWYYLRLFNFNLASGKPVAGIVQLLEQLPLTKQSAVLNEKLGDLYVDQGKPLSAEHAYAEALELKPSPQQRIRLRLTLGQLLVDQGKEAAAYDNYLKLLDEAPDYPGKVDVYRKLVPLAGRLDKKEDGQKWEAEINRLTQPPPGKS